MGAAWSMNSQGASIAIRASTLLRPRRMDSACNSFASLDTLGIAATLGDLGSLAIKERAYDTAVLLVPGEIAIFRQLERLCFTKLGDRPVFLLGKRGLLSTWSEIPHKELARHSFS